MASDDKIGNNPLLAVGGSVLQVKVCLNKRQQQYNAKQSGVPKCTEWTRDALI